MYGRGFNKPVIAILSTFFLILSAQNPAASANPVAVATYQVKVVDPRTDTAQAQARIGITTVTADSKYYEEVTTNSSGLANLSLAEGIHYIYIEPNTTDPVLGPTQHVAKVTAAGSISFKSGIATAVQPFVLPLKVANVWGTVGFPVNVPSQNASTVMIEAFNTENYDSISRIATQTNRQFGMNLYPGTWQIKARWIGGDEVADLFYLGPSDPVTVTIDSNNMPVNFPSSTGLTLTLKAPTISGTIALPDGARVSGWRIEDPQPNWVNIKEGRTPYINFSETTNSLGQGSFALWIDPAYKPAKLSFSVVSNGVGYSKTIDVPSFTTTLNLGTILAEQSKKVTVNLGSTSYSGYLELQKLNANDCDTCWNSVTSLDVNNQSVITFHHVSSEVTYRVNYQPGGNEPQIISTTSAPFTITGNATAITLSPVTVALKQFKVVDPTTNAGVPDVRVVILTPTKSFYKNALTGSDGIAAIGAPAGTYLLYVIPEGGASRLLQRAFELIIANDGTYTINNGVSTVSQPFILPLALSNVWGSVTVPDGSPQNLWGGVQIQFTKTSTGEVETTSTSAPGNFTANLSTGTWQVRTSWYSKGLRIYEFGPADVATVVVNSDGTSNLNPTSSGLTLALKAPNVTGVITKPDGTRASGWRIYDPDPDWETIKKSGGNVRPINLWEAPSGPSQGEFALWIDPNSKPNSLRFSLETESVAYGKTVIIPAFTNTLNLGTLTSVQAESIQVNLASSDIKGTIVLQQRKKNSCESCWSVPSGSRSYETFGNSSLAVRVSVDSDYDYRLVFEPASDEVRYISTATSLLTFPVSSAGITMTLKSPSIIGRVPSLTKSDSKKYFADVLLLREETYSNELVAKGYPASRWFGESSRSLYFSPTFAFTLQSGIKYRLYINPSTPSQTNPSFVTETFTGPEENGTLGEVTFAPGTTNLSGSVSANGSPLINHPVTLVESNRPWNNPLVTYTDSQGKYYFRVPAGTYQVTTEPTDVNGEFYSKTVSCQVISGATKLDCNLELPQNNFRFKLLGTNSEALNLSSWIAKIDDVTDPSAQILAIDKYFNFEFPVGAQYPRMSSSNVAGVRLENGRYLLSTSNTLNSGFAYGSGLYQVIVANNSVISVKNLVNNAGISPSSNIFSLPLPQANVTGIVTLDGETVKNLYGYVQSADQYGKGWLPNRKIYFDESGRFYDYQLPGNYRYEFRSYVDNSVVSDNLFRLKSCTVTSLTVQANCDLSTTKNFRALVKRSNNELTTKGSFTLSERRSDGSLSQQSWGAVSPQGEITLALADGEYELQIDTTANNGGRESSRIWIDVAGGVVTRATKRNSLTTLTQLENRYQISTQFMGIAGTVVAPNGTTPVANSQVMAFGEKWGMGTTSQETGRFEFPNVNSDGTWRVEADAPSGNNIELGRSNPVNVTVVNGVGSSDVVLTLRATTARGTVFGTSGAIKGGYVEFRRLDNAATGQWSWAGWAQVNQLGQFGAVLTPGTYFYYVRPAETTAGVETMSGACVVPTIGFVTCDLTLAQPNFAAKIIKSDGLVSLKSSYSLQLVRNQDNSSNAISINNSIKGVVDQQGVLRAKLANGEWYLYAAPGEDARKTNFGTSFRVVVVNNQVTLVEQIDSITPLVITPTDGMYSLPLKSVNLIGQVTFQNKSDNFNSLIRVVREVNTEKGTWYDQSGTTWTREEGRFELNVQPGTYQLEVIPYVWSASQFTNGVPAFTRKLNCVVPTSGSVTCDVALNAANFLGKVTDAAGVKRTETYINVVKIDTNGNQSWIDRGIRVDSDANFYTYLEDGTYRITITPYWEYRLNLIERSYRITVASGAITEVLDLTSNQALTKDSSNRYTLKFGTPSVMGTVLMPGTSTQPVANIRIEVRDTSNNILWQYQTYTNNEGQFSLALPDGEYRIAAVNDGKVRNVYKSALTPLTVANATAPALTLRLREANLSGVVVLPGTTTPVANVNVNLYVDGEWQYTWTDETGTFGMFVENPTPNCPSKCSIHLNTWELSGYLPKSYPISAVGNIGNVAIGVANTRISVLLPQADGTTTANVGGWVLAQKLDANGNILENSWGTVNKSGLAYFSFEQGARYRIHANPGYEMLGKYSRKVFDIASHDQSSEQVAYTITFDSPNLNITVRGWDGLANSWGYYRVVNGDQAEITQGSLNFAGQAALTITANGTYTMTIYPGKSKGVVKTVTFTVNNGVITSSDFTITNGSTTIDLPRGNVEGLTRYSDGSIAKEVLIAASRSDDATLVAKTASSETGTYFLNLDRTYTWNIKFFDPQTSQVGQLTLTPATTNFNLDFPAVAAA